MRFIRFLIAFACLAVGAIVGALNRQSVAIDLGVGSAPTTLGVALILTLLIGVAIGGLAVTASLVLPLRRRLARAEHLRATPVPSPEA
ncbi:MAG: LapA family protein [Lysobacter sp.]